MPSTRAVIGSRDRSRGGCWRPICRNKRLPEEPTVPRDLLRLWGKGAGKWRGPERVTEALTLPLSITLPYPPPGPSACSFAMPF